jgi:predicted DNA-binding protein (UPF0251 family)
MDQPRRRGRPNIFEATGLTMDQIQEVVNESPTLEAAALRLGIGKRTVERLCRAKVKPAYRVSGLVTKADELLGDKRNLGPEVRKAAKRLGLSDSALYRALNKRARRLREELDRLGDFRQAARNVRDVKQRLIWTPFIQTYELEIDRWTLAITLSCQLASGPTRVVVDPDVYRSWFTNPT